MASWCSVRESTRKDCLTCHICSEVFTDPRILPCLHTYCFRCICNHVDTTRSEDRSVVCPECQEPFTDDVSSLQPNVFSDRMVDVMKHKNSPIVVCMPCQLRQQTRTAEMMCLNCSDFLCSECGRGHRSSSLTVNHQVVLLQDLKQSKYETALGHLKKIKCQCGRQKDEPFFCQSCSQLVCMPCVLIGHKGHRFQEVSEAVGLCKSKITVLVENTRKRVSELSSQEMSLSVKMKTISTEHRKQERLIEEKAEREIAKIIAEKMKLLNALEVRTNTATRDCNEKMMETHAQKDMINSCLNVCDTILKMGKDEEVLMLETMVTDRLQQLKDLGKRVEKQHVDDVRKEVFDTSKGTEAMKSLKFLSTFTVSDCSDSFEPDIRGLAYSSKFGLVAADAANGCIKILQENGDVTSSISYPDFEPFAVSVCKDVIAAVSDNYLYLLKVSGAFVQKVMLHDEKPNAGHTFTFSIAASEPHSYFIVANIPDGSSRLHCYGLDGVLRHYISCTFTFPISSMCVTSSDCIALCEWKTAQVRILSMGGSVLSNCEPNAKWRPSTVYSAKDGHIFVTDWRGKGCRVYGFDENGTCQLVYRIDVDGLTKKSFLATNDNGKLYVLDKNGKMCVYSIVRRDAGDGPVG